MQEYGDTALLQTTTNQVDGYRITEYLGIVGGDAQLNAGVFGQDYEEALRLTKEAATKRMLKQVAQKGGNGIVGIRFNFMSFGDGNIGVSVNGTGVILEKLAEGENNS